MLEHLEAWVRTHPDDAVVGVRADPGECVIARYIKARSPDRTIRVFVGAFFSSPSTESLSAAARDPGARMQELQPEVVAFIRTIDRQLRSNPGQYDVLAREALAAIEQVRRELQHGTGR